MVGFQQSAQSLDADDLTLMAPLPWFDDPTEALADPPMVVVLKTLGQDIEHLLSRR